MNLITTLLNLIFPEKCAGCGKLGFALCPKCNSNLNELEFPICVICENLSIGGKTHKHCAKIKKFSPTSFNATYIYNSLIKKIIFESKYKNKSYKYLNLLTIKTEDNIKVNQDKIDLITFIPFTKRRNRLIDHSEYVAKNVSRKIRKKCIPIFKPGKNSYEQKKLNKYERVKNTKNKFEIPEKRIPHIKNKRILLVDDICTTGSSLISCSKLLMQNGAKEVHCYTLAKDFLYNTSP